MASKSRVTRTVAAPTAAHVRAWVASEPKRLASLTESARRTVQREGLRGRLAPEVISLYNKGLKSEFKYVSGATKAQVTAAKAEAKALREQARAAGFEVKDRGPLPKAFMATLKG